MDGEMLWILISNIPLLFSRDFWIFSGWEKRWKRGWILGIRFLLYTFRNCWVFVFYYLFLERMKRVEYFGNIYIVLSGGIWIFLDFLFAVFAIFMHGWCTEDERDWNEYFGFIRDFYCTCFQIFEFLSLLAYIFWRWRDWIEYFEFSISIFFIKEHFND